MSIYVNITPVSLRYCRLLTGILVGINDVLGATVGLIDYIIQLCKKGMMLV